ncbi:MAG: hypothetical protein PVJ55_06995 [Anaerolineae bacterium]|jgi:hypothetical protein
MTLDARRELSRRDRGKGRGRRAHGRGQVVVITAVGAGAVLAVLVFLLNAAALLSSYEALDRTMQDAATAGLRSARAGSPDVDTADARAVVDRVLEVELQNVRFLQESPADLRKDAVLVVHNPPSLGASLTVDGRTYYGPVVEVGVQAHLCPPLFACIPVEVRRLAALEAETALPQTATPVPPVTVQITLTPTP